MCDCFSFQKWSHQLEVRMRQKSIAAVTWENEMENSRLMNDLGKCGQCPLQGEGFTWCYLSRNLNKASKQDCDCLQQQLNSRVGRELILKVGKYKRKHGSDKGIDTLKHRLKFQTLESKLVKKGQEYMKERSSIKRADTLDRVKIVDLEPFNR